MKCYKLLTKDLTTHGKCLWVPGEWKKTSGEGDLCGLGWLHAYEHPLLAVMHNPIHAKICDPVLYETEAEGEIRRDGLMKFGATRMRIVKELPLPEITVEQRIRYGIFCAWELLRGETDAKHRAWRYWARRWLNGKDRTARAAYAARKAAYADCASNAAFTAYADCAINTAYTASAAYAARADVDLITCAKKATA